jgi:hypothetical protein
MILRISIDGNTLTHNDKKYKHQEYMPSACEDYGEVILKGEYENPESDTRNAYIRLFSLNGNDAKAILRTSNSRDVHSIKFISYQNHKYVLVSGNGSYLDIFKYDQVQLYGITGRLFLQNLSIALI